MASWLTIMASTSSSQSSCQPHHQSITSSSSSWKVWAISCMMKLPSLSHLFDFFNFRKTTTYMGSFGGPFQMPCSYGTQRTLLKASAARSQTLWLTLTCVRKWVSPGTVTQNLYRKQGVAGAFRALHCWVWLSGCLDLWSNQIWGLILRTFRGRGNLSVVRMGAWATFTTWLGCRKHSSAGLAWVACCAEVFHFKMQVGSNFLAFAAEVGYYWWRNSQLTQFIIDTIESIDIFEPWRMINVNQACHVCYNFSGP